jgi:flagellar biogenesis protein FliO
VPDFSQSVTLTFVFGSIGAILALVGVGIFLVKKFKKEV